MTCGVGKHVNRRVAVLLDLFLDGGVKLLSVTTEHTHKERDGTWMPRILTHKMLENV